MVYCKLCLEAVDRNTLWLGPSESVSSDQQVDVIVISSNCSLDLSKGRASKALLEAAGDGIQTECRANYPNGIHDGEIAITSGGQLSCKAIYHGALSKYACDEDEEVNEFGTFSQKSKIWYQQ